ncbi:helix-turn-helix domain-containing protein [Micrococcus luteus]|uniref:helix-turn-helix domain-containing protein n=1 Tax=Micrococcus luteus TaxID=1270 RepID=UPI0020CF9123|nr:helix-turn-helix transcriptional regulator [Micrococcus luteus]UTT46228.1 helix-turn-helix domain-containing protein [Micrococcus luteus]
MTKRIEEVIGENIRARRDQKGYPQAYLGERVGALLGGTPWKPQTVSAAEKGRRQFIAAELIVIAQVLNCRVQDLLAPSTPQPVQISDVYVRDADYSAPLENVIDAAPIDLSSWLRPFSEAYREVIRAREMAESAAKEAAELKFQLHLTERALARFVPDEVNGDAEWWDGVQPFPEKDEDGDGDGSPFA